VIATPVSAEFLTAFQTAAGGGDTLRFDRFMELALYHPILGYYRRNRTRVGTQATADFFTASASSAFGELIVAAVVNLLGPKEAEQHTFVEVGPETLGGVLASVKHPFASARTVRVGELIALGGKCVVFSNELFDAQPCRRFVFRRGSWRELGVRAAAGRLKQVELESDLPAILPQQAPEDYHIDAPLEAALLVDAIVRRPWTGLFLTCDYGRSWAELAEATPAGTARAYRLQHPSDDLLADPGEQDLTCHICWDWIAEALQKARFAPPVLEDQETFFVRHAGDYLARVSAEEAGKFSARKQSIFQLLHPAHMGQKFQVLHAFRAT
jgi:SAM-dependent MidA family methyltransferase